MDGLLLPVLSDCPLVEPVADDEAAVCCDKQRPGTRAYPRVFQLGRWIILNAIRSCFAQRGRQAPASENPFPFALTLSDDQRLLGRARFATQHSANTRSTSSRRALNLGRDGLLDD